MNEAGAGAERILVLNPGSTSTKLALYEGEECVLSDVIRHTREELSQFAKVIDQLEYRKALVLKFLDDRGVAIDSLSAVVGRGGLMKPIMSGTYAVNDEMLEDVRLGVQGEHASNLGAGLVHDIASRAGIPSFVVDPVVVDELDPLARLSGMPEIDRKSIVHALNVKATARAVAKDLGRDLADLDLVIAHMGGGISVCAIRHGRMVDVSSALSAGPMTPERAGTVPTLELVALCFSGRYDEREIRKKLVGHGGLAGYLGTNSAPDVVRRIEEGDDFAERVMGAMIYQIAKEIGAMATVVGGHPDAVVLTGGLAHNEYVVRHVTDRVKFLGPVIVKPGEDEMQALALGCLRVLRGEEKAHEYPCSVDSLEEC